MFSEDYPHIANWVEEHGWIGRDDFSYSFIRALDIGGLIWEGETSYKTVDDALQALEIALTKWFVTAQESE